MPLLGFVSPAPIRMHHASAPSQPLLLDLLFLLTNDEISSDFMTMAT